MNRKAQNLTKLLELHPNKEISETLEKYQNETLVSFWSPTTHQYYSKTTKNQIFYLLMCINFLTLKLSLKLPKPIFNIIVQNCYPKILDNTSLERVIKTSSLNQRCAICRIDLLELCIECESGNKKIFFFLLFFFYLFFVFIFIHIFLLFIIYFFFYKK